MKLPDDKQERIKIFALIAIFAAGFLYLLISFALTPYFKAGQANRARLIELEDLLWRADRDIASIKNNLNRNTSTVSNILEISEVRRFILRPSLGNYLLVASEEIEAAADSVGIEISNIRDTSGPPPNVTDNERNNSNHARFWNYSVDITLSAGIHDSLAFIQALLSRNPYLSVHKIIILPQSNDNPLEHVTNIGVQWPVWRDHEHPNKLAAEQLADGEQQ